MKLTALASILTIILITNAYRVNAQSPQNNQETTAATTQELQYFEAILNQLDTIPEDELIITSGSDDKFLNSMLAKVQRKASDKKKNVDPILITLGFIDLSKIYVPDSFIRAQVKAFFSNKKSSKDCPGVAVKQKDASEDYVVYEDYQFNLGQYRVTAWKGFEYDRASIPPVFWALRLDKDSLSNVAPLFHDLMYRHGGALPAKGKVSPSGKTFTRDETDLIFRDLMKRCGVSKARRELAYIAVSTMGKSSWKGQ